MGCRDKVIIPTITIFIMLFGGMFLNVFIEFVNENILNFKFCFLKLFILFFCQKCITKIRLLFIKWSFFIDGYSIK